MHVLAELRSAARSTCSRRSSPASPTARRTACSVSAWCCSTRATASSTSRRVSSPPSRRSSAYLFDHGTGYLPKLPYFLAIAARHRRRGARRDGRPSGSSSGRCSTGRGSSSSSRRSVSRCSSSASRGMLPYPQTASLRTISDVLKRAVLRSGWTTSSCSTRTSRSCSRWSLLAIASASSFFRYTPHRHGDPRGQPGRAPRRASSASRVERISMIDLGDRRSARRCRRRAARGAAGRAASRPARSPG